MSTDSAPLWWPLCLSEELNRKKPIAVNCGEFALALFRDAANVPRAVENRCPHRRVPLSLGRVSEAGWIQCAYHGWAFDGHSGHCQQIPTQSESERVPERYRVGTYPVQERDGFVFVWLDSTGAAPELSDASTAESLPPPGTASSIRAATGLQLVTIEHDQFIAALLDDPSLVLSVPGIHITEYSLSDIEFDGPEMTIERAARWHNPFAFGRSRVDSFASDYPLVLRTRTHAKTGFTTLTIMTIDGRTVLDAAIACAPELRGVTAVRWRARKLGDADGMRAKFLLSGARATHSPLAVHASIDGARLAAAVVGPSHQWRQLQQTECSRPLATDAPRVKEI